MSTIEKKPNAKLNVRSNNKLFKAEKLKLIEGDFSCQEAKELLLNIFSTKINFHKLKNFSSQERTGSSDIATLKRLNELQKEAEKLNNFIKQVEKTNCRISITSSINLNIVP